MTDHAHNSDPAAGPVCSHAVTTKMLLDWGIDVEIVLDHLHVPGPRFHSATHRAWQRGLVRVCTLDPRTNVVVPRRQSDESRHEALAWVAAHRRPAPVGV